MMAAAAGAAGIVLTSPTRVVATAAQAAAGPVQIDARFYPPSARKLLGTALRDSAEQPGFSAPAAPSAVAGVMQGRELSGSRLQHGQVAGDDDLLQLEQLLEQQLSEMELLGKDPAAAAAAMQAPARRSAAVAAHDPGAGVGAAAAAAWQAGYDGDVDTASGSSGSGREGDNDDGSSSSSVSRGSIKYRAVEGGPGRLASANRIERLVAMYRQQQQQQHVVEINPELPGEHDEEPGWDDAAAVDSAGNDAAGLSEMLSRFLQE
jgi:hypothetical protein